MDFHPCTYDGATHLCVMEGKQDAAWTHGHYSIYDTNLQLVRQIRSQNGRPNLDMHETNISPDGTRVLITVYSTERYDLSDYNISTGQGWVMNCMFQDIDTSTGNLNFEWSSLDHISMDESFVLPDDGGAHIGMASDSPYDFFHINSIDRNEEGDYLISGRHTSTLYKVNGTDGSIIWRLGGKLSNFSFVDDFHFDFQHNARWIVSNDTADIISLFDNGSNGIISPSKQSQGMIISLDLAANSAELLKSFPQPAANPQSVSQGNLQVLDLVNWDASSVFLGWGQYPCITEYDTNGNLLFEAQLATEGAFNYRAYKFPNLTLTPTDVPAVYTYAQSNTSGTVYYMSWNGATDVARWRMFGRASCDDDWTLVDTADKQGFETNHTVGETWQYGMVEAVDGNGNGIKNSSSTGVYTFIPSSILGAACDEFGCQTTDVYDPPSKSVGVPLQRPGCPFLASQITTAVTVVATYPLTGPAK